MNFLRLNKKPKRRIFGPKLKLIFSLLILALGFWASNKYIPSHHLFWRSLNPDAPVGLATSVQLTRLGLSPSFTCETLARSAKNFHSTPADPKDGPDICGWNKARWVKARGDIKLTPNDTTMQCPLALGTHIWAGEIDRLAQEIFDQSVVKIHHAGTYSCRRQRGNNSGAWSEHAFANAWDITGFTLSNGDVISVLKDWNGAADKKRFLRAVRSQACKIFRVTLSPDYNAAHHDHFHVDMGPTKACR